MIGRNGAILQKNRIVIIHHRFKSNLQLGWSVPSIHTHNKRHDPEPVPCNFWYLIYLSTAIGLTPGGSSTVNIYTQTVHRTTQITTNLEECGPCPVLASFTMAFALQLRKKHGKTSVRVAEECLYIHSTLTNNILKDLGPCHGSGG